LFAKKKKERGRAAEHIQTNRRNKQERQKRQKRREIKRACVRKNKKH